MQKKEILSTAGKGIGNGQKPIDGKGGLVDMIARTDQYRDVMNRKILLNACSCLLWLPALAGAQQAAPAVSNPGLGMAPVEPDWALQITPYIWAPQLSGSVSPFTRGPTIGVRKSFSEILDDLNLGGFLDVWGRYGQYVFSGDVQYTSITESKTVGSLPVVGATPGLNGAADTKQFIATLKAGIRVYETERQALELVAGMRYWHVSNDVQVNYGQFTRSYGESFDWVDPVIGARYRYSATENWTLQVHFDAGGAGVGSRHTWQFLAVASYNVSDRLSVSAGYKILDVDYRASGHVYDTTMRGPAVGLTYRF